jgi:bacillithiol biosynthesis deacetylase BshB1
MQVDLLAFGPHPDDIEIGMAATLIRHVRLGTQVGLCDLTRGEMGSNGTLEERIAEAGAAARVIGAAWRVNLELPDGGLAVVREQVTTLVDVIRRARPTIIALPHGRDRHPDHGAAHQLIARAIFDAGLRRFQAAGEPWRPSIVCRYFINDLHEPSFVVDVSDVYDGKREALACYRSQFEAGVGVATRLNSPLFAQLVESRDAQLGARAGVRWAEGFVATEPLRLPHLFAAAAMALPHATGQARS